MRGADFTASPTFEQISRQRLGDPGPVRSELIRQRRELVDAATRPGDGVAVPAHASRDLVDAIKACGRTVVYAPIGPTGATDLTDVGEVAAVWHQTVAGVHRPPPTRAGGRPVELIDAHDSVVLTPASGVAGVALPDTDHPVHVEQVPARRIVAEQIERIAAVTEGLRAAAALPIVDTIAEPSIAGPVPTGVVVRLPAGADPLTFASYAQAELTGIDWFALRRPIHPQARHHLTPARLAASLEHLARLIVVPVSPLATPEEIGHAVLGIVKTAEYTGWRWHDQPEHARTYAESIAQRYGHDHEAYRPAFGT